MILLVMAAGMGSRFGGLKQAEPVGPNGEFILDYNIKDAVKYGFKKVIFIIKKENLELFKSTIGKRLEGIISVEYAFQDSELKNNLVREKPWGTAHAIYSAKDLINDKFLVINADDYYGEDCFKVAMEHSNLLDDDNYYTVAYKADNTISLNGSVKRGILKTTGDVIDSIIESKIIIKDGELYASLLNEDNYRLISKDTRVSMNALLFTPKIFDIIEREMDNFIENANLESDEFLIPEVVHKYNKKEFNFKTIDTSAKWIGMTYREDLEFVKKEISKLY